MNDEALVIEAEVHKRRQILDPLHRVSFELVVRATKVLRDSDMSSVWAREDINDGDRILVKLVFM